MKLIHYVFPLQGHCSLNWRPEGEDSFAIKTKGQEQNLEILVKLSIAYLLVHVTHIPCLVNLKFS